MGFKYHFYKKLHEIYLSLAQLTDFFEKQIVEYQNRHIFKVIHMNDPFTLSYWPHVCKIAANVAVLWTSSNSLLLWTKSFKIITPKKVEH